MHFELTKEQAEDNLIETLPAPDRAWVIAGGAIAALQALLALGLMTSPKK